MSNGSFRIPEPTNEPVLDYAPGSPERAALEKQLDRMASRTVEQPCLGRGILRFRCCILGHDGV